MDFINYTLPKNNVSRLNSRLAVNRAVNGSNANLKPANSTSPHNSRLSTNNRPVTRQSVQPRYRSISTDGFARTQPITLLNPKNLPSANQPIPTNNRGTVSNVQKPITTPNRTINFTHKSGMIGSKSMDGFSVATKSTPKYSPVNNVQKSKQFISTPPAIPKIITNTQPKILEPLSTAKNSRTEPKYRQDANQFNMSIGSVATMNWQPTSLTENSAEFGNFLIKLWHDFRNRLSRISVKKWVWAGVVTTSLTLAVSGAMFYTKFQHNSILAGNNPINYVLNIGNSEKVVATNDPYAPTKISIDSINLNAEILSLENTKGAVAVPKSANKVGWLTTSNTMNKDGLIILSGLASDNAVFSTISKAQIGKEIILKSENGKTFTYRIIRVVSLPKTDAVSLANKQTVPGSSNLNLIACSQSGDNCEIDGKQTVISAVLINQR